MTNPEVRTPPVAQCARAPSLKVPRGRPSPPSSTPGVDVASAQPMADKGRLEEKDVVQFDCVLASIILWRRLHVCALFSRT